MTLNPLVSVNWLSANLDIPNLVILDASVKNNVSGLTPEFPNLQIKGARRFDMENVFVDKNNPIPNMFPSEKLFSTECQKLGIDKNSVIVVYDNLGIYTSPRAWWMFKTMGHPYVTVLDGGLSAWKNAGLPCEILQDKQIKKGDFEANYQPEMIVDAKTILKQLGNENIAILDARAENRFNGSVPEPRENMASGHIPGAINFPYKKVLNNGKMLPKSALKKIIKELGVDEKELIFTCGSGVTACIILLATALVIDNPKTLYDGSWSEWGQLNKFPVEQ
jgi:thiosulfate/3-mercaptopyruvate sulfurtransferase